MKKITFFKSLLVVLALSLCSFAAVAEEAVFENSFSAETMQSGVNSYTDTWDNISGTTLTLCGFNNNQKGWSYVKCGREKYESVATITTGKILQKVTKIIVTVDKVLAVDKIKSAYLEVATDEAFSANKLIILLYSKTFKDFLSIFPPGKIT